MNDEQQKTNNQPKITLESLLTLCADCQEIMLIFDEGVITSASAIMARFIIEDLLESLVVNIETEGNVLKVWI